MFLPLLLAISGFGAPSEALPLPTVAPVFSQEEEKEEVPDERPEVEELLDLLLEDTRRLGKADERAVQTVKKLAHEFTKSGPRDRRDIVDGLYKAMRVKRRISKDGSRQRSLFLESARALAKMAPESVKPLIRLVDDRNHKDDFTVRCEIISALGLTKDERGVKTLLGLLDEFQARLQASAATALGNFGNLDQKVRKEIFEDLLKLLCSTRAAVREEPDSSTNQDRWRRISGPVQKSLRRLSGATESGPEAWRRWWNKNKRRNWDEGE